MTNKINTGADAKALFRFNLIKSHSGRTVEEIGTAETIEFYKKWRPKELTGEVTAITERWPEGVTVETTGRRTPFRCYVEATYAVVAPRELTDFDFQLLRAQGAFMGGQQEGAVMGEPVQKDGVWTYTCMSICDSGD